MNTFEHITPVPVLSIIGYSGSGKTTLLEQLIPRLKLRGLRIGILKHDAHKFEIDREGKDTWRFSQAGADVVAISSASKTAVIENTPTEPSLDEMLQRIPNVDLIITEGYKTGDKPKIEVHRKENGKPLYSDPDSLVALVTDEWVDTGVPCYSLDDVDGVAERVVEFFFGD